MMKLSILRRSNLNENYYHSAVIPLLRGLAAVERQCAALRGHPFDLNEGE
jgi:hypothetical protein